MGEPVDLDEQLRQARRRHDWKRVHIEADRREPLSFVPRPGKWINIFRGGKNA